MAAGSPSLDQIEPPLDAAKPGIQSIHAMVKSNENFAKMREFTAQDAICSSSEDTRFVKLSISL